MAIPLLALDDRKFTDLVDELRALIPRYSQRWTDYNVSDPGIMLMELFAWLTEALLYRINRVPEASRVRLLELLGAAFQPAAPAVLQVMIADEALLTPYVLPRGTQIRAKPTPHSAEILFETIAAITLAPETPVQPLLIRQSTGVKKQDLGVGTGAAHQIFELPQRYLLLPSAPFPQRPTVWVNDQLWTYRASLDESLPTDCHFTVKPWLNALLFGDGAHGQIPGDEAKITAAYRSAPAADMVQKALVGLSNGQAGQVFRLVKPLLPLDLQAFDDLIPTVWVNEQPWEYRATYLAMAADALTYTVEPWRNALRFGDGAHGQKLAAGAELKIDYHYTAGQQGNVPNGTQFTFDRQATGHPHLRVEETFERISLGRNPTGPDAVDDQLFALLQEQWRAITSSDVETVIRQTVGDIAHAYCLPGCPLDDKAPALNQPGQMGVILTPQPTSQTQVPSASVQEMLGLTLNGQRFVARDQEGIVHLWDANSGEKLAPLGTKVRALACHPDGALLAVASADHHLWLWNSITGDKEQLYLHPASINAIAFGSAQEYGQKVTYVATACADHLVRVWRTDALGKAPVTFQHAAPVNAVMFNADGTLLVSAGNDGRAFVWSHRDRQQVAVLSRLEHHAALFAVAFSPDSSLLATAGLARMVSFWLWPEKLGQEAEKPLLESALFAPLPHAGTVLDIAFHPQQHQLVTACRDGTAQLWDIDSATRISIFQHTAPVNAVAIDPSGKTLATASADHTVGLWDLVSLQKLAILEHHATVNAVVFLSPQKLVTGCDDGGVRLWLLTDLTKPQKSEIFPGQLQAVTFSPDGQRLTALAGDRYAALWDTATGTPITNLAQAAPVKQVRFSPDGQRLATAHARQQVRVWDAAQGKLLALLPGSAANLPIVDMVFRLDKQQLATVNAQHTVRLWTLSHKPQLVWPHHLAIRQAGFAGDGTRLLTVDNAGVARLWDTKTGELCAATPQGTVLTQASVSTNGKQLAVANNRSITLWDVTKKEAKVALVLSPIPATTAAPLSQVTFDAQGRWLAASADKTVYLWDLSTAQMARFLEHPQVVTAILFAANGEQLATVTADGNAHLWHVPTGDNFCTLAPGAAILSMAFREKPQQWITLTADQTLSRWNGRTGQFIAATHVAVDHMDLMCLSPDGRQLATVADGVNLCIHVVTGNIGKTDTSVTILPQAYAVEQLIFHPTASQLVTVNRDATVYLWSTQPATPTLVLPHRTALTDLHFNADGTRLAVRMVNQKALLWSTRKMEARPKLLCRLGDDVRTLAFSPDGQHLATAHTNRQVRLWSAKSGQSADTLSCDGPVAGLVFSPSNRRLLTISTAESACYTLQLWDLRLKNRGCPLRQEVCKGVKALLLNRTGQWLALVTDHLLSLWDIEQGKQLSTLYLDFADPQVQTDPWLLYSWDPQNNLYRALRISSQTKDESAFCLTQGQYLLATSSDTQMVGTRTIAVWNAEHVYAVDNLLQQRRLLTSQTQVAGLQYMNVALTITAMRKTNAKSLVRLEAEVTNALLRFFHPLTGGPDGKGWPPGRAVYRSEVYQVIEGVAGVDHVAALQFDPPDVENCVVIPPYQKVNARIQVEISD